MVNASIFALLFTISLPSHPADTGTAMSRVDQVLKTELGLSLATFSYLIRRIGSSETLYVDSWSLDDLNPNARVLEANNYLRLVVFKGGYQGRNVYLIVYRPTEKSLPILEQTTEVEWDLARAVQPPSAFENFQKVYDSI